MDNGHIRLSKAIDEIPEYPFAKISRIVAGVEQRDSVAVIKGTVGNPDKEAPAALKECAALTICQDKATYGYPCDVYPRRGIPELIEAIITDYKEKYGVVLSPGNVAVTGWAKESLHNLVRLFGPGDVQIPDPVYPVYESAAILSGNVPIRVPTTPAAGWVPRFHLERGNTVALYLCDPNNPTGSVADMSYYISLAAQMKENDVAGIFDKAYKDYVLDERTKPVSVVQVPGLMERGFEVYSFSKHYNLVGVGLGWVVSSEANIDTWLKLTGHINQGVAWYKQRVGVEALTNPEVKDEMMAYFREIRARQKLMVDGLNSLGLTTKPSAATPYLWVKVPEGRNDEDFVINLIERAHVAFTPGSYFGENGRGYLRSTLFMSGEAIEEALERIDKARSW